MTRRWLRLGLVTAPVVLLAGVGGAAAVETHDGFCAGCHLPPEAAFVARASGRRPVDLASAHARLKDQPLRCVDCHGGSGWRGRLHSLSIGAADVLAWARGDYVVVGTDFAPLGRVEHPIDDELCVACHTETTAQPGFEKHFHNTLDDQGAPDDVTCVTCHAGHRDRLGDPHFISDRDTAPACDRCHAVLGGPHVPPAPR